jgi:hypothetical protein
MTAPATVPASPAQTHPCARCGAPVALDVGLCDRCNPLGLKDSASSQVHGTVILAVGLAIASLAIAAHLAVASIGPFNARVMTLTPGTSAGAMIATIEVRNDGRTTGSATCRLTAASDPSLIHSTVLYSPPIAPGATITIAQEIVDTRADQPLTVTCSGP